MSAVTPSLLRMAITEHANSKISPEKIDFQVKTGVITVVARRVTSPLRTPTRAKSLKKERIYEIPPDGKSRSEACMPHPISKAIHIQQIFKVTSDSEVRLDDDAENFFPTFYD